MRNHKTEPIVREQNRRKFFARFVNGVPFAINEATAKYLTGCNETAELIHSGGFKRVRLA